MKKLVLLFLLSLTVSASALTPPSGNTPTSVSPVDFGATFDGVTDDHQAWQDTIDWAIANHLSVKAPCGTSYLGSTTLLLTSSVTFSGSGPDCTTLTSDADAIVSVSTPDPVIVRDLTLECTGPDRIYHTGLSISPSVANRGSIVTTNRVSGCKVAFLFSNTSNLTATFNRVASGTIPSANGIIVGNSTNIDSGDSLLLGNWLYGEMEPDAGSVGIRWTSSGGLKMIGNKILGYNRGIYVLLTDSDAVANGGTCCLFIQGNSIEQSTAAAIDFLLITPNRNLQNVIIVGNELAGCPNSTGVRFQQAGWLSHVIMGDNRLGCGTKITGSANITVFKESNDD